MKDLWESVSVCVHARVSRNKLFFRGSCNATVTTVYQIILCPLVLFWGDLADLVLPIHMHQTFLDKYTLCRLSPLMVIHKLRVCKQGVHISRNLY